MENTLQIGGKGSIRRKRFHKKKKTLNPQHDFKLKINTLISDINIKYNEVENKNIKPYLELFLLECISEIKRIHKKTKMIKLNIIKESITMRLVKLPIDKSLWGYLDKTLHDTGKIFIIDYLEIVKKSLENGEYIDFKDVKTEDYLNSEMDEAFNNLKIDYNQSGKAKTIWEKYIERFNEINFPLKVQKLRNKIRDNDSIVTDNDTPKSKDVEENEKMETLTDIDEELIKNDLLKLKEHYFILMNIMKNTYRDSLSKNNE